MMGPERCCDLCLHMAKPEETLVEANNQMFYTTAILPLFSLHDVVSEFQSGIPKSGILPIFSKDTNKCTIS